MNARRDPSEIAAGCLVLVLLVLFFIGVAAWCLNPLWNGDNEGRVSADEYMAEQPCEDVLAKYATALWKLEDDLGALRRVATLYTLMAERNGVDVRIYSIDARDRVEQCR